MYLNKNGVYRVCFFTSCVNHLARGSIFGIILGISIIRGIGNVTHTEDAEKKAELPWCCLALPHSELWMGSPGEQESLPAQHSALSCTPGTPRMSSRMLLLMLTTQFCNHCPGQLVKPKRDDPAFIGRVFTTASCRCCFTVCASLISDTSCSVAAYLLKLFWFVLALSCLQVVCV